MNVLEGRLVSILDEYRRRDRLRTLESIGSPQGRLVTIGEEGLLNFSSNDYLGLSAHPALGEAARDATRQYGVGSGASALLSGRSEVHEELERRLAKFLRRDRALLYSSGYLANLGVVGALVHPKPLYRCGRQRRSRSPARERRPALGRHAGWAGDSRR